MELEKYYHFFRFILKYWHTDLFSGPSETEVEEKDPGNTPKAIVEDLKKMGPTYIKLGQLLSTRPDMLPKAYLEEFQKLQDEVDPIPYSDVEKIFQEEIGVKISKAFTSFEEKPLATASIGQVHKAVLLSGKKVAVKIQKPGIKKKFIADLEVLLSIAQRAEKYAEDLRKFSIYDVIEEFQYTLLQELDYRKEAQNLILLKKNLKEFELLSVPSVVPDYCSGRVLTMSFIEGRKVTDLSPFQLQDIDSEKIVDQLIKGYLKQIIVDGLAHADPHPGNIQVTTEGKLALMDLGMVVRFNQTLRKNILKLLIGIGNNDAVEVSKVLLSGSEVNNDSEENIKSFERQITRKVQENEYSTAKELKTGQSILEINKIAAQHDIKLPIEYVFLGKILLNLDQIIAFLSPNHQLQKTVRSYSVRLIRSYMKKGIKPNSFLQNILESKELLENLPYRLNKITKDLSDHQFKMEMKVIDEKRFILVIQKIANRIAVGIVVAALILGAALIMQLPTHWMILGYPGFGILLFACAALIGFYLVYEILFKDESRK